MPSSAVATSSPPRTSRRSRTRRLDHRVTVRPELWINDVTAASVISSILSTVPAPVGDGPRGTHRVRGAVTEGARDAADEESGAEAESTAPRAWLAPTGQPPVGTVAGDAGAREPSSSGWPCWAWA